MQRTTDFHNEIAESHLPLAVGVMDDATALHTAVYVLNAYTLAGNALIGGFLCTGEGSPLRLLGWYDDLDLGDRKRQKAQSLAQSAADGNGVWGSLGHALVMGAPGISLSEKDHCQRGVDQPHVSCCMASFLAAITARLLSRILGAHDALFRPIVSRRGKQEPAPPRVDRREAKRSPLA
jgi:hypothetical protein